MREEGQVWRESEGVNPLQRLEDARFHRWYRFVLAYSDKLVTDLIGRYDIGSRSALLDPFCGTGTTLVAAKGAGISSVGIDSNPAAVLASNVKTNWDVDPDEVQSELGAVRRRFKPFHAYYDPRRNPDQGLIRALREFVGDSHLANRVQYFEDSGMLERRWMFETPMLQSFALMHIIETSQAAPEVIDLLRLLLVSAVQESISNVGFGPELYVKKAKLSQVKDALGSFALKVSEACEDLRDAPGESASAVAVACDSRDFSDSISNKSISHVITSPPYPTEKDYTRNSRLELVFLGFVTDKSSLRDVKREMIRSHSKGIYKSDGDSEEVASVASVQAVADELRTKAATKTYGFAKLYPKIITEYFGGMRRHFRSLHSVMSPGGIAAYVVGEQTCYLQTYTPTATLLGEIGQLEGFELKEILPFRIRAGTTGGGRHIKEEVLVLRRS